METVFLSRRPCVPAAVTFPRHEMELLPAVLRVYESGDPPAAFHAMADALSEIVPLHCAMWIGPEGRTIHCVHPRDAEVPPELLDMASYALRSEVFPLDSLVPDGKQRYPSAEVLLLPLPNAEPRTGSVVLIAAEGTFGDDLELWEALGAALGRVAHQQHAFQEVQRECEALRQRAEEIEALNVLGLAANRTLDPEEVLTLVARFTRTLLGANYVTVNTMADGQIRVRASIGLRSGGLDTLDDPLAAEVIKAGKPLAVGEVGGPSQVGDLPLHAAEGMQVGLGIPLSLFGDTFGALVVGYRRTYQLTSSDTRLALTLAGHAAVAISNAQLHQTVEEHSRALEQANEELRQISIAKERFFASMSHELRTPINAITGYGTLLLDGIAGEITPNAQRYLQNSQRAAKTLLYLVNDILDLSKLAAGKMEVLLGPCALRDVAGEAISTVQPLADSKGIRVQLEPAKPLPVVQTDADRVRQILVNLLSNAVKFTERGEVSVVTHTFRDGPPDVPEADPGASESAAGLSRIEIHVSDTGAGIAPENLGRIFEEYEQVLTPGSHGGTGLGLPISRKLARLLGGDLLVESRVGVGSTFILRLPGGVDTAVMADTAAVNFSQAV